MNLIFNFETLYFVECDLIWDTYVHRPSYKKNTHVFKNPAFEAVNLITDRSNLFHVLKLTILLYFFLKDFIMVPEIVKLLT